MRQQIDFKESQGKQIDEVFYSKNNTQIIVLFLGEEYSVIDFNDDNLADPTVFEEDLSMWGVE